VGSARFRASHDRTDRHTDTSQSTPSAVQPSWSAQCIRCRLHELPRPRFRMSNEIATIRDSDRHSQPLKVDRSRNRKHSPTDFANLQARDPSRILTPSYSIMSRRQGVGSTLILSGLARLVNESIDNRGIGDLVQNPIVDETENLVWEVLGKLGDKSQAEPAFPTTTSNSGYLLEKYLHLCDPLCGKKLVRFLDQK
jgi:hypothetical protein